MKLTILGAAGLRTPLIVRAVVQRQRDLGIDELALMDVDGERLKRIREVKLVDEAGLRITPTTAADEALRDADFVITTFRVGGMEARVKDETIPLRYGVLGQETTGPGGFAMAMRSIPVLLDYVQQMADLCPDAWLLNFSNPSGIMAEAALRVAGWTKTIGICDAPEAMLRMAAYLLGVSPERVSLDYFGLNHLGWIRRVLLDGQDVLPAFLEQMRAGHTIPDLPFSAEFMSALGMIPNEYLVYYYQSRHTIHNLLQAEKTRGEDLLELNRELLIDLNKLSGQQKAMNERYRNYLNRRWQSYMAAETGVAHENETGGAGEAPSGGEGYAGVALDIVAGLNGASPRRHILNVFNHGAVAGMDDQDVVEIPVSSARGQINPLPVGEIPIQCLGLMKQVKAYERLTIDAAVTGSYDKAWMALTLHPLVADEEIARRILDEYIHAHGEYFPILQ